MTRLGVVKLASCDGCQLTLLDLEDELLGVAEHFEIVEFPEATSRRSQGPFDLLLVEGSVSSPEHLPLLRELRAASVLLVTIGACATAGGIQALRNWADQPAWHEAVYPMPGYVASLAESTPVSAHVRVDAELRGCPIDGGQLLELLSAHRAGRRPQLPDEAVCTDCKRRGVVCVMVTAGQPCLGPVTQRGCGAICPSFARGCYGCFGPKESANVASLRAAFSGDAAETGRLFAGFSAYAEPFRPAAGDWASTLWSAPEPEAASVDTRVGDARPQEESGDA